MAQKDSFTRAGEFREHDDGCDCLIPRTRVSAARDVVGRSWAHRATSTAFAFWMRIVWWSAWMLRFGGAAPRVSDREHDRECDGKRQAITLALVKRLLAAAAALACAAGAAAKTPVTTYRADRVARAGKVFHVVIMSRLPMHSFCNALIGPEQVPRPPYVQGNRRRGRTFACRWRLDNTTHGLRFNVSVRTWAENHGGRTFYSQFKRHYRIR